MGHVFFLLLDKRWFLVLPLFWSPTWVHWFDLSISLPVDSCWTTGWKLTLRSLWPKALHRWQYQGPSLKLIGWNKLPNHRPFGGFLFSSTNKQNFANLLPSPFMASLSIFKRFPMAFTIASNICVSKNSTGSSWVVAQTAPNRGTFFDGRNPGSQFWVHRWYLCIIQGPFARILVFSSTVLHLKV